MKLVSSSRCQRTLLLRQVFILKICVDRSLKSGVGQVKAGVRVTVSAKYVPRLHVILWHPEIPPNTGNIGRSCVAVGAKLWLVRPLGFDISEKQLRRAGLDYWQHLEWEAVDSLDEIRAKIPEPFEQQRVWLFTKFGQSRYSDVTYEQGDVLLFGCESAGLPEEIVSQFPSSAKLRLPMRPQVRSLNLSSSATAAMYEVIRQIGTPEDAF